MKFCLNILFFLILSFNSLFAQQKPIILGFLVKPPIYGNTDKDSSPIIIPIFQKINNHWTEYNSSKLNLQKLDFTITKNGKSYGSIETEFDSLVEPIAYNITALKIISKNATLNISENFSLSGFPADEMFSPFILTNTKFHSAINTIKTRKPKLSDSLTIYNYLKAEAKKIGIGNLNQNFKNVIGNMHSIYIVDSNTFLIETDIKLNMYCYNFKIPFIKDTSYKWGSTERMQISQEGLTPKAFFMVKNGITKYIDYYLNLITNGDYDNDGYDEVIFNFSKYNEDGFIMLQTRNFDILESSWNYH